MTVYPAKHYEVAVYRSGTEQTSLSTAATAALVSAEVDHALIGGCLSGRFEFARDWSDGALAQQGDEIRFSVDGQYHFRGFVEPVDRSIAEEGRQSFDALGWWHRLSRLQPLEGSPTTDRVEFGVEGDDQPTIKTAAAIIAYLLDTYVVPDTVSPITYSSATVATPTYSTKVGRWTLLQDTKLGEAFEQLATMDDCFVGVDAQARFYVVSRKALEATAWATVQIGDVPANAAAFLSELALLAGNLRTEGDPVIGVSVGGRDTNKSRGRRKYYNANPPSSGGRVVSYYKPEIQRGQGARRYAAGKLRQFGTTSTVIEDATLATGIVAPLECFGGLVTVKDEDGSTIDSALPSRIRVRYASDIVADMTLGLLQDDPGSSDPANDALAPTVGLFDDPVIDIGDSYEIDFTDGAPGPFGATDGGDFDDLHSNAGRDIPTDAGAGTDLDYGTDEADSTNGAGFAYLLTPRSAIVKAKPSTGVYNIKLTDEQGNEVGDLIENCETFPTANDDTLSVDDAVVVFYRERASSIKPSILSGVGTAASGDAVFAFTSGGAFWQA